MNRNNEISTELNSISPFLGATLPGDAFIAPEGYFESLPQQILAKLTGVNEATPELPTTLPFSVPAGYFDNLAGNILSKIRAAETLETANAELYRISPVLAEIGNKNVYSVPGKYFETLNVSHSANPTGKLVSIKPGNRVFKYLAAATITGLLGLSLFNVFNDTKQTTSYNNQPAMAQASEIIKNNSFDAELNKIPADDIEQFLRDGGQDVTAALVVSATDDAALPDAEDYIFDENTLNEFLNKNNLNN